MKIKYLVICVICLLTGCQATAPLMKNSITFVVGPSDFEHNFFLKTIGHCVVIFMIAMEICL
jgi:hypothetical protein